MPTIERRRPPISTRHAFALALDLAARRDPVHSLLVPLLLRAPWTLALVLLPPVDGDEVTAIVLAFTSVALIGDFVTMLVVGAMLRVRARSVYNTAPAVPPAPVAECYARGAGRIPWLLVTELVRNLALALAASVIVLPTAFARFEPATAVEDLGRNLVLLAIAFLFALPSLFVVFRLAVATEAVVLDGQDLAGGFQSSFRMMRGHLERWCELVLASALLVVAPALALAVISLAIPALAGTASLLVFWLVVVAVWPVVQYAWAFFYLRLVEIQAPVAAGPPRSDEGALASPVGGAAAGSPRLELVGPAETGTHPPGA